MKETSPSLISFHCPADRIQLAIVGLKPQQKSEQKKLPAANESVRIFFLLWMTSLPLKNMKTARLNSNYHMPRYSERGERIAILNGWMTRYLHQKTRYRTSHHALGLQMSPIELDTNVSTSITFAGCVMQQLRTLNSNRYLSRLQRRPEALSFTPLWIHDDSILENGLLES